MAESSTQALLGEALESIVLVKLRGGIYVRGKMKSFDQHLNLLIEDAEEMLQDNTTRSLGTIIVRGDNVILISPSPR
ncbi:RNA-binding protein [Candidatus Marsarchaeota G2 archaeon ECH_B_SAG-F08]|jgi:small nuclear ribonucleoprotein|uniref:Putative snRNP Sm-like protein n=5 Tax=Candidatus Marsarchaeota TaxID=1978152 RepID=A0A2R6AKK6_9ARCH|nr:MAG: RNA-binding protein [Candidatus Marsarchaeota G1 archaeon OSP_D]PSN86919.1 MAG: RNA-binding protein [Candidatus Marsarchaeota G1 archaeon BE_D]PSN89581.1 MAG: RNA-binding protein [Candidatus Marsarchaeota G1 archaeon OSP_C]PSN98940.1 MAG: RNA-binding protein [Candidatus Marsarchaeota G2 archaeon ECH_B_SAG-F08]PSO03680.1 MAG: RNA-binding protein [Candidatus Marsarchaeota G2 archaeon ECH_B_SAG-E12]